MKPIVPGVPMPHGRQGDESNSAALRVHAVVGWISFSKMSFGQSPELCS
jgi:hypothetical protein